jgi:hypothetical protein
MEGKMHFKKLAVLVVSLLVVGLISCGESPEVSQEKITAVINDFLKEIRRGDHDDAADLTTGEFEEQIEAGNRRFLLPEGVSLEVDDISDIEIDGPNAQADLDIVVTNGVVKKTMFIEAELSLTYKGWLISRFEQKITMVDSMRQKQVETITAIKIIGQGVEQYKSDNNNRVPNGHRIDQIVTVLKQGECLEIQ